MLWKVRDREIQLGTRTLIMGILNVTPDSFSDGGQFLDPDAAVTAGQRMLAEGADCLDIGGESSRPGAEPVSVEEELRRVVPVVDRLFRETGALISVDTTKARVAEEAIAAGAAVVNDISALQGDARMGDLACRSGVGLILMHMQGTPQTMQQDPRYDDVVRDVVAFLRERGQAAFIAGVLDTAIVYDPGIGFGKTYEHNLALLRRLPEFRALGRPLLVGASRKAFIGKATGEKRPDDRLEGTAAAVTLAIAGGAAIVRVHDVEAMAKVARLADAVTRS
jgi:dihydropteroate synthase